MTSADEQPRSNILKELETKFNSNLEYCLEQKISELSSVEIRARGVATLGQILSERSDLLPHQKEIIAIFDEVFTDMILSLYLSACSLDKPAEILLRRVLELGFATVYLWDMPYAFWGWKSHNCDLNFNQMTVYLKNDSYKTFIKSINTNFVQQDVFDCTETQKLYRELSNTAHGKISTFESNLPQRFTHSSSDWINHLALVKKVQYILFQLWEARFIASVTELNNRLPALSRWREGDHK